MLGVAEHDRFLDLAVRLPELTPAEIARLTVTGDTLPTGDRGGIL